MVSAFHQHFPWFIAILISIFSFVNAQNGYTDGPFVNIPTVNTTSSARPYIKNYCPLLNLYLNKTIKLRNGLYGQTLYVGFNPAISGGWNVPGASESLYKIAFDPINGPVSGFYYELMNALSDKLHFKLQWVYVPTKIKASKSLDFYLSLYKHVDVTATGTTTDSRYYRASGLDFTMHMYEQSCNLVSVKTTTTKSKFWNFVVPFEVILWILVIFAMVITSIFLKLFNPSDSRDTFMYDFFRSMNTFTGEKLDDGDNIASIVLSITLNFVMLIIAAAYTANLTTVLITNHDETKLNVPSFQYANSKALSICATIPSPAYSAISALYPSINWLNGSPIPTTDLKSGRCQAFMGCTVDIFNGARRKLINPKCDLGVSTDDQLNFPYALPITPGPNGRCTDFLRDVLSFGIMTLKQDGTIHRLLQKSIGQQANVVCPDHSPPSLSLEPGEVFLSFILLPPLVLLLLSRHTNSMQPLSTLSSSYFNPTL